jgi:hypothetical protein
VSEKAIQVTVVDRRPERRAVSTRRYTLPAEGGDFELMEYVTVEVARVTPRTIQPTLEPKEPR